jgi:hypothetical protein
MVYENDQKSRDKARERRKGRKEKHYKRRVQH